MALKFYFEFEEVYAEAINFEILKWQNKLHFALKNAEPSVPEDMHAELEKRINIFNSACVQF